MGSSPRKVDGGNRMGIRPKFASEPKQNLSVDQGANSTTPYREYREYKQDKNKIQCREKKKQPQKVSFKLIHVPTTGLK